MVGRETVRGKGAESFDLCNDTAAMLKQPGVPG